TGLCIVRFFRRRFLWRRLFRRRLGLGRGLLGRRLLRRRLLGRRLLGRRLLGRGLLRRRLLGRRLLGRRLLGCRLFCRPGGRSNRPLGRGDGLFRRLFLLRLFCLLVLFFVSHSSLDSRSLLVRCGR